MVTREVEVPGPERIVEVPGPERIVERIVEVEVPGPERIVEKIVEVPVEPKAKPKPAVPAVFRKSLLFGLFDSSS